MISELQEQLGSLSVPKVMENVGASEHTYAYIASYLQWRVVIGGLPTVVSLVLGHLVRAEGNTKQASIGMPHRHIPCADDPILIPMLIILNHAVGLYGLVWSQPISDTSSLILGMVLCRRLLRKNSL